MTISRESSVNQLNLFDQNPFEALNQTSDSLISLVPTTINLDQVEEIPITEINGLLYVRNFIDRAEHDDLLSKIDSETWLTDLKRRVQHYGYKYDYKNHEINRSMFIAPLPDWAMKLVRRLHGIYSKSFPDQIIVNEYEPGQGIENHIDCKTCFQDTIISLSLGSACAMDFIKYGGNEKKTLWLEPRSLIVLKDEARYEWTHGIAKRKSDIWQDQKFLRSRRVSLTFRTVIIPD